MTVLIGCKDDEVAMFANGEVGVKVEHKPLLRVLVVIVCASVVTNAEFSEQLIMFYI